MKKSPRQNKTKEQIAFELKQKEYEAEKIKSRDRKRKFVGEVFFPILQKHTTSVRQAQRMCQIISNDILSTFNQGMLAPLETLELTKKIEGETDDASLIFREILDAFKDMPIGESLEIIDGFPQALTQAFEVKDMSRSLNELEWADGVLKLTEQK